jgi:dipeptide/tripeptide permease
MWLWPLLQKRGTEPSVIGKIIIGIICAALAFLLLSLLAYHQWPHASLLLVLVYLLLGSGEICLTPAVLSITNERAPHSLKSTLMGNWYMFVAIAGICSGQLSTLTSSHQQHHYGQGFMLMSIFAFVAIVLIFFLRAYTLKLLATNPPTPRLRPGK